MVVQYASQIPSSRHTRPVLQSQVESLLRSTYRRWKSRSLSPGQGSGPSVAEIPWDDVIALCINHKLRDWIPPRLPVTSGGQARLCGAGPSCGFPGPTYLLLVPFLRVPTLPFLRTASSSQRFQVTCQLWEELRRFQESLRSSPWNGPLFKLGRLLKLRGVTLAVPVWL